MDLRRHNWRLGFLGRWESLGSLLDRLRSSVSVELLSGGVFGGTSFLSVVVVGCFVFGAGFEWK